MGGHVEYPGADKHHRHMQDCFRQYPEVYGAEIADEEAAEAEAAALADGSPAPAVDARDPTASKDAAAHVTPAQSDKAQASEKKPEAHEYTTQEYKAGPTDAPNQTVVESDLQSQNEAKEGSERGVPKNSFDATATNAKESK